MLMRSVASGLRWIVTVPFCGHTTYDAVGSAGSRVKLVISFYIPAPGSVIFRSTNPHIFIGHR
jgi:hypothetical protein